MDRYTPNVLIPCQFCDKKFLNHNQAQRHERREHPEKYEARREKMSKDIDPGIVQLKIGVGWDVPKVPKKRKEDPRQ